MTAVSDTPVAFPFREQTCEQHGEYRSTQSYRSPTGREYWTGCPDCAEISRKAADAKAQAEADADQRRRRIARLDHNLQRAAIPTRFADRTFASYRAETDEQRAALKVAQDFAQDFARHLEAGTSTVFSGRPGTGKSHLACAIAKTILAAGHTALYATVREIVLMLRETWRDGATRSEQDVIRELSSVDLLVIDEVGVGFGSEAEKTQFFDIIDGRYREVMPTILLTNLDRKGLAEYVGQRAFDRLRENGIWVPFDWDSHRGRKAS